MKRLIPVYTRDTYLSGSSGGVKVFRHDESLFEVLGQGKVLLLQVYGYRKSATARATIKVYESSLQGRPPSEIGTQVGTTVTVTTLRPGPMSITGPFQGRIEVVLEIDDTAATSQQEFDLVIAATLIIEE